MILPVGSVAQLNQDVTLSGQGPVGAGLSVS